MHPHSLCLGLPVGPLCKSLAFGRKLQHLQGTQTHTTQQQTCSITFAIFFLFFWNSFVLLLLNHMHIPTRIHSNHSLIISIIILKIVVIFLSTLHSSSLHSSTGNELLRLWYRHILTLTGSDCFLYIFNHTLPFQISFLRHSPEIKFQKKSQIVWRSN